MSNCQNNDCGCLDEGLTTSPPCNGANCPDPDPCPETFSDCCVVFTGDSILDIGINQGDRLCDILQKLTLLMTQPECVASGSPCVPPVGFRSTSIGSTSISLAWYPEATATNGYSVEYREISSGTWLINPTVAQSTAPSDTIGGLTPDTYYYIRVRPVCDEASGCYSVTIIVKTKAT